MATARNAGGLCLLAAALLLGTVGCAHRHRRTWKHATIEEMHATLLEQIPPQTPLADARAFMQKEGFRCTLETNSLFVERNHWSVPGITHEGLNYLRCYRAQGEGHFLTSRIWTIALVHDDNVVTEVIISMYIDGP